MQEQFSIVEAKNKLPSIIHYVEKGPYIKLTRRGKTVAVLLSIKEYERLSHGNSGFWDVLSEFRQNINNEKIDITDKDFEGLRDKDTGREVEYKA
jgi:antitoxin Phd